MRFNGTVRRGLCGTATAVAAMAALTASQAPGLTGGVGADMKNVAADDVVWTEVPNDDSYHTELPPLTTPVPPKAATGKGGTTLPAAATRSWAEAGIPSTVLAAYRSARTSLGRTDPGCRLPWQLLAAIGKVESGHAAGGRVDARGTTLTRSSARCSTARASPASPTPTAAGTTATPCTTGPSAPCSSSPPPGRTGVPTATATGARTRTTSTTRPSPPATTSAPDPATCRCAPTSTGRSSATTTRTRICVRSCRGWSSTAGAPTRSPTEAG